MTWNCWGHLITAALGEIPCIGEGLFTSKGYIVTRVINRHGLLERHDQVAVHIARFNPARGILCDFHWKFLCRTRIEQGHGFGFWYSSKVLPSCSLPCHPPKYLSLQVLPSFEPGSSRKWKWSSDLKGPLKLPQSDDLAGFRVKDRNLCEGCLLSKGGMQKICTSEIWQVFVWFFLSSCCEFFLCLNSCFKIKMSIKQCLLPWLWET